MATHDLTVRAGWLLWVSAVDPSLHSGQKKAYNQCGTDVCAIFSSARQRQAHATPKILTRFLSDGSEPLSKHLIPGVPEV